MRIKKKKQILSILLKVKQLKAADTHSYQYWVTEPYLTIAVFIVDSNNKFNLIFIYNIKLKKNCYGCWSVTKLFSLFWKKKPLTFILHTNNATKF